MPRRRLYTLAALLALPAMVAAAPAAARALESRAPLEHARHGSAGASGGVVQSAGATTAQPSDTAARKPDERPGPFSHLRWRSVGPNRGGRSIAAAGSPGRPLEYFFGATGGGVWKTTDGGTTWQPVGDTVFATSSVSALAVAESNPDIVFAGFGETQLRGNVIQGDGVYKSTDAGKTWTHVGLADTQTIARIRIHPANPDIVFVAALGHTYGPNPERGVFRSKDGGRTWQHVLARDEKSGAVDLVIDRSQPDVVYAGFWEVFRTPHSLSSGGPGSGLFKSVDGGETWSELTRNPGLPTGTWGKVGVSVSGADPQRVYAIIEAQDGGLFISDDAGATWTLASGDRRLRQRAFYYTRVYADPKVKDTVYVMNVQFLKSDDAGKTWTTIRVPHGDNHDLWIDPNDSQRMINANDGGANVSFNGGRSWTDQDYPTAQMYNVFTTTHVPYHVCGAQQDNSTACVPSTGNGSEWYAVAGCESGYIAVDPRNPDVSFGGCYGGSLTRFDRKATQMRAVNIWPENPMGHSARDIAERFQWTYPILFSPTEPGVLYASSQHLWKTTTEGQSWQRISPDLTRADPATLGPSGGPITLDQTGVETYATIFTVAPSRLEKGLIWTGSDDGLVHITRNGGETWDNVTPPDLPAFSRISVIEASPHAPGTAYLAANRYQLNDRGPYVYRTEDFGGTWQKIVAGLPATDFARVVREDPQRQGLLYLGTEHGIHVSFDNGGRWQSLRLNLPVTPVHGIVVEENDLVIGTHGRSFFVLDGIAAIRQHAPGETPEMTALRVVRPGPTTRRVQMGAPIDYWLSRDADEVKIEVLDASGRIVRSMTGRAEAAKKEAGAPGEQEQAGGRGPGAPRVGVKQGMNRVLWDMRHDGPTTFPGLIMWAAGSRGPLVKPGLYEVRVSALRESATVPLEIRKDPRTAVADADLDEQERFALEIRDTVSRANDAVVRIRAFKQQVKARTEKASRPRLSRAGEALTASLTEIEGEIYQYRNQSSQDPLNYPIKLNNKIAALLGIVESADGRPTEPSYTVFTLLKERLEAQLARLDTLERTDVAAFNRQLASAKLPPVDGRPEPSAEPPTPSEGPDELAY
ncbi:MAG: glycosyl hydrolase [Vicinamibacteraceae bacterium]|nr:glycosyl hydrolase [Vicinamibacteraceae bacterium]